MSIITYSKNYASREVLRFKKNAFIKKNVEQCGGLEVAQQNLKIKTKKKINKKRKLKKNKNKNENENKNKK